MRRLVVLLALLGASLLAPSFASAAAPLLPGLVRRLPRRLPRVAAVARRPRSPAPVSTATWAMPSGPITTDAPARRAGAALIAAIWAMTILGFGTVAVLLRRTPPPPEPATA